MKCKWIVVVTFLLYVEKLMSCPLICKCTGKTINCSNKNISSFETLNNFPSVQTEILILDYNNLQDVSWIKNLPNLKDIRLSNNLLTDLNVSDFSALTKLKYLNVSRNNIKTLPKGLFGNRNVIQSLDFSYNELDNIDALSGNFGKLKKLYLHGNKLKHIDPVDENILPNLEILKASYNEITLREKNYNFKAFPKLQSIELDNNKIGSLNHYFMKFSNVRRIVLSHNEIVTIPTVSFAKNFKLQELYLGSNKLKKQLHFWFNADVIKLDLSNNELEDFTGYSLCDKFQYIDLSNNKLRTIKPEMFRLLKNLTSLNLHNNGINFISQHAFESSGNLKYLNISSNDISIGMKELDHAFKPLVSLKTLDMSKNKILLLPSFSFAGLSNLETLNLDGNDLKYIRKNAFANLEKLTSIRISTTSLDCDCSISWFKEWLSKQNLQSQVISGKCGSPKWQSGKEIMSIPESEFTCIKHDNGHTIRPNINKSPLSSIIIINRNLSLKCEATSSVDVPITINWYRDSVPYKSNKIIVSEQRLQWNFYRRSSMIKLNHIRLEDRGKYWCEATNMYGSSRSPDANITVVIPPVISKGVPSIIRQRSGEDAQIKCSAEGVPSPYISFSKINEDKSAWNEILNERRIHYQRETFIIQSLKVEDSGLYACTAQSKVTLGNNTRVLAANATVRLIIYGKPTFTRPMRSKRIPLGTVAVLGCIISGNPRPKISWYKDNKLLHPTSSIKLSDQMLIINNFQETDVGSYACHATNKLGSASQSARLIISHPKDEQKLNVVVMVMTVVVVFTVTSFIWFLFLIFCRRRQICMESEKTERESDINQPYKDDKILPELPKNYTLRCNGQLVSPPPPPPPSQSLHVIPSVTIKNDDLDDSLCDQRTALLINDTLRYLREQQGVSASKDAIEQSSELDDTDTDQHDSGILVHYKSRSSLGDQNLPLAVGQGLPSVTIDLNDSKDYKDRRKQAIQKLKHKYSSSIDSSFPCTNNNSEKEKLQRWRRLAASQNAVKEDVYFTSSSGIESGESSTSSIHGVIVF